jgi:hypothetical protein
MEKNTKILLGLGAVIAAYIILKPKKTIVITDDVKATQSEAEKVLKTLNERGVDKGMIVPNPITKEEINAYYDMINQRRKELGIPPDFIDNSEECKRNPYMCKM